MRVFNAELRKSGQVPMTTPHAQAARNRQAARMVRAGREADLEQQELTDDQGEPLAPLHSLALRDQRTRTREARDVEGTHTV